MNRLRGAKGSVGWKGFLFTMALATAFSMGVLQGAMYLGWIKEPSAAGIRAAAGQTTAPSCYYFCGPWYEPVALFLFVLVMGLVVPPIVGRVR